MFHVPEHARVRKHPKLGSNFTEGRNGAFLFDSIEPGWKLFTIAGNGDGWEHVSVHAVSRNGRHQRVPSWREMCQTKYNFWDADDVVVQFHPRESDYINQHPYTLHLWRPIAVTFPTPDPELVGERT